MKCFSFLCKVMEKNYYNLNNFPVLSRPCDVSSAGLFLVLLIMTLHDIYKHPRRFHFLITYMIIIQKNHLALVQGQDTVCQLNTPESKSNDSFTDLFSTVIYKQKEKTLSRK